MIKAQQEIPVPKPKTNLRKSKKKNFYNILVFYVSPEVSWIYSILVSTDLLAEWEWEVKRDPKGKCETQFVGM